MKQGKTGAVIVAAGTGERMGQRDKVFANLGGEVAIGKLINCFEECYLVDEIVVVMNEANLSRGQELADKLGWSKVSHICVGGARRQDSVKNGLQKLTNCEWAIIHDGARPMVDEEMIINGLNEAKKYGAAIAAVPVKDTIKQSSQDGLVHDTLERENLWSVQTPQIFRFDLIWQAHLQITENVSDDAAMVERLGHKVKLYMGSYQNIKITTPEDLALAEVFLEKK